MRKLRLDVEALEVQSFLTTDERTSSPGTVEGFGSGRTPSLTRQESCAAYPCATAAGADTCDYTCDGWTCVDYTCDRSCQTNVCACALTDIC